MTVAPLAHENEQAIAELRATLEAAGYTREGVSRALGPEGHRTGLRAVPMHLRRLGEGRLPTLIRLLFLNVPVPAESLERAVEPLSLADFERLGLARVEGETAHPVVRIVPHEGLMLASDPYSRGALDPPDFVAGYSGSANTLYALTARRRARRTLDVGTGSGIHALAAAAHSDEVVATDVNPRALAFTEFNARLNGIGNVETRLGGLFEPVAGERFDLVVANLPYVISPDAAFTYRDSGLPLDGVSEQVVREVPAYLEEGAFASILASWVIREEGEPWTRPRSWVADTGCDAWIILGRSPDPVSHAANWLEPQHSEADELAEALDRWVTYLESFGIVAVVEGAVILRRRSTGANWVRTDTTASDEFAPAGDQIERVFAATTALAELERDDALLDLPLVLAERVRFDQVYASEGGRPKILETRVRLEEGIRPAATISPATSRLLSLLDTHRTLRAALAEVGAELSLSDDAAAELERRAVEIAKEMYASGFLIPKS